MSDSPLLPFVDAAPSVARFSMVPVGVGDELPDVGGLLAGAAEVDITPPPGMPKAGFSKNAHDGRGFRTRLKARVLHLRAGRTSMALVQLDLLSGSALLQHLVARAVAARTDVRLPGLFLGATHTHAGPGQFDASAFYNRFASNRPGFDPAWTQWLADRIAAGVIEAVETRRPATIAVGRTEVWGLTRNRSLAPYVRNENVDDRRLDPQRKFAAVNPWLHLLRVDADAADGGTTPLAAMTVFSIHGTGISHHCDEYHADVWAYLTGELADRIERSTGTRPVVGAVEGTHADCAPALRPGRAGFVEAERIGRGIGAEAAALYDRLDGAGRSDLELVAGVRELDLDRGGDEVEGIRLAQPLLGASQVAGAKENLTPVIHRIPPFRAGFPKPAALARGAHGPKWVLGSRRLQPRILPTADFPRVLTVQVLRIGDHAIVGAPFEITVETGRRIAAAVEGSGIGDAIVSSVANGYCGYCTTPEEYELQYYEGGHNLHGPTTQAWLATQCARLAGEVAKVPTGHVADLLAERAFVLPAHRYLVAPGEPGPVRRPLADAVFHDPAGEEHGWWEQRWLGPSPGSLRWHEPLVRVEVDDGRGWRPAVDDQRGALGVTHAGAVDGGHAYVARWSDPWLGGGRRHRFLLEANGPHPELALEAFS
jgi:neutral ceramidase